MSDVAPEDVTNVLAGNATLVVPMITLMAKSYTRGRGFVDNEPNEEIAAVITAAAARFVSNPAQVSRSESAGSFSQDLRGGFNGWSLAEQTVLNRYRVRAM